METSMKLYTTCSMGNKHADLCMIVASLGGQEVQEIVVDKKSKLEKDLLNKSGSSTLPILEFPDGTLISQSLAIARLLAKTGTQECLVGESLNEQTQVDQWTVWIATELTPVLDALSNMTFGRIPCTQIEFTTVQNVMKEKMKIANNALKGRDWICGTEKPTIADIQLALVQFDFQYAFLESQFRSVLNNANKHFKRVTEIADVKARIGASKQGKKQIVPIYPEQREETEEKKSSQESAPKKANKGKEKEEEKKSSQESAPKQSNQATLFKKPKEKTDLSKTLSFILRHGAANLGLRMDSAGFMLLFDLLASQPIKQLNFHVSEDMVKEIVNDSDKQRFQIQTDDNSFELIRAVQGHTMDKVKTENLLDKVENPFEFCAVLHGTYKEPLPLIMKGGLNRMARNHIHMAVGMPKSGVISGMRSSTEVVVEINMAKAMYGKHKVPFYVSQNKVLLSPGLKNGSLPPDCFRSVVDIKAKKVLHSAPFDYIVVYDFECTCCDKNTLKSQEIIEFPCVIVNVATKKVEADFQVYVKPVEDPQLTEFCTDLTGITQAQVDAGVSLEEALKKFHAFLGDFGIFKSEFVLMSCGDFDGNHLKGESTKKGLTAKIPNYLKRWLNIKKCFPVHFYDKDREPLDFTSTSTIKSIKAQTPGMVGLLNLTKLELVGKHHSGLADSHNIARILIQSLEKGYTYTQGMVHSNSY